MTLGAVPGSVRLMWRTDAVRTAAAGRAVQRLADAAIRVENVVSRRPAVNVDEETDRLERIDPHRLEIRVMSADETGTRLELRLARGSSDKLARRGSDVLAELDPHVPVVVDEDDDPPVLAGDHVVEPVIS